ncbi:MFS transporter [Nonomuraea sp. NPDC046570]|uniref:MFS transporter n=1 Tax=Nonomuraea sp. NPDC046570 TaxID=3155255 RepID=UPI0033D7A5D2
MYALLFADTGLSPAQISSLFVLWSVTGVVLEVPSGVLADRVSRRLLLVLAPLVIGAGFALWTFVPSYPAFAAGFVLWGAGSAMRSGTLQALVYEELARTGRQDAYTRLLGRSVALGTIATMVAGALAAPAHALGGYQALGVASVAVCVLGAAVARTLPESRAGEPSSTQVLRHGLAQVRRSPHVLRALVIVSVVSGVTALDEYLPLLVKGTGVATSVVPLFEVMVTAAMTVGGWYAGRGSRAAGPVLALGALGMAAGAATGSPAGFVPVAVAFGVFQWAMIAAEARLQDGIDDGARATVTSMAGLGGEAVAVLTFAGYALGSVWAAPRLIFVVAAVPYLVIAVGLRRG